MPKTCTPLELSQKLIGFNTVNPPGDEHACAQFAAGFLEEAGFQVACYEFDHNRTSVVADCIADDSRPPICFSGHLDTVPLGKAGWSVDPFAGHVASDRLYGRGAADMKAGLAAMLVAACGQVRSGIRHSGIRMVLTAGEENGCQGARYLAGLENVLGHAGALVIAEPTANYPVIGHKGAFWLEGRTNGVTAHGAMPDLGDNAVYKAARAITLLEAFRFSQQAHPLLGPPTLNVGTVSGGINVNSVPDRASFTIDIRMVPPQEGEAIRLELEQLLGPEVEFEVRVHAPAVETDPRNPWVQQVFQVVGRLTGEQPEPRGAAYFTDASALKAAMGDPPTVILGPGEAHMAHKTDEYCLIPRIESAARIYRELAASWCAQR